MVNKYWSLEDFTYETIAASIVCYGVIVDPDPFPVI